MPRGGLICAATNRPSRSHGCCCRQPRRQGSPRGGSLARRKQLRNRQSRGEAMKAMKTKARGLSKSELPAIRRRLGLTIKTMAQAVGLKLPSYYYYETRYV